MAGTERDLPPRLQDRGVDRHPIDRPPMDRYVDTRNERTPLERSSSVPSTMTRSTSMDASDYGKNMHTPQQPKVRPPHPSYNKISPYGPAPPYSYSNTRPPQQLHSVVTSSFSAEDDRDVSNNRNGHRSGEHRFYSDDRHVESYESEVREGPPRDCGIPPRPVIVPPSPGGGPMFPMGRRQSTNSIPSPCYATHGEPLKRSFWHHSRPNEEYSSMLPRDFVPPKRAKINPPPRNITVSVCSTPDGRDSRRMPGYYPRGMSWESREDSPHYPPRMHETRPFRSEGRLFSPMGGPHPPRSPAGAFRDDEHAHHMSESPRVRTVHHQFPGEAYHHPSVDSHGRRWGSGGSWSSPMSSPHSARPGPNYRSPMSSPQLRDEVESMRAWGPSREREPCSESDFRRVGYESNRELEPQASPKFQHRPMRTGPQVIEVPKQPGMPVREQKPLEATAEKVSVENAASEETMRKGESMETDAKDGPLLLLALPQDRISLSETLCVVRENIEVFTATKSDVEAPAPGRKHAVVVNQVGLRCIHCRHTTRCSDRVKRAVCYPSSIKRIYRTVIDMKLDHFLQCKYVPTVLKDRLTELKVKHTRSTGTTMQYFIRAAHALGMEDGPNGVILNTSAKHPLVEPVVAPPSRIKAESSQTDEKSETPFSEYPQNSRDYRSIRSDNSTSSDSTATVMTPEITSEAETFYTGRINLALAEDKMALSPLRCFLREQVCAFSATAEDIAVRAPTTFSISIGQVGIGCIHCVNQPSKLRSNRAVCFPFSIARIYQSVADIQRFHFSECQMLPPDVKEKFLSLQRASSKGSKGLATRQYWVSSARKIGLVDTPRGIRFGRDPMRPEATSMSLDILAQVAFNVTTASRALVLPEDKPYIAEFLYVVMEQLQPCRFTEADRNKRRLKDVGCIGVECKHCAGQVDGRKFFWSSVNAVESNFVSVHTHMMECRMVPPTLKEELARLKKLRKEQTAALKTGSQKAFFSRVWARLHGEAEGAPSSGSTASPKTSATCSPVSSPSASAPVVAVHGVPKSHVDGVSNDMSKMSVMAV